MKLLHVFILSIVSIISFGQNRSAQIEIVHANTLKPSSNKTQKFVRLLGNVQMKHEGALMFCDSAHFYPSSNSMVAFENVHINQGDSLHLYGDLLNYDGNSKMVDIQGNVKLQDPQVSISTPSLIYDRKINLGFYTQGAEIISRSQTLRSVRGQYDGNTKMLGFKKEVELETEDYSIHSDTMFHHSETEQTWFYGPTEIESNGGSIYCRKGYFNANAEFSWFVDHVIIRNESQTICGDSIFYNQKTDQGQVYNNVVLSDSLEGYRVTGAFARYAKQNSYAFVTGSPVYSIDVDGDSLHLSGDTLLTFKEANSAIRQLKVYHNVVIYKSDFQGKCDSLFYIESDSTFQLYNEPILWTGKNQMTSDHIALKLRNGNMDSLFMTGNAFMLSENDGGLLFDQIKGRNMYGQFRNNELQRIFVSGNGQTVYNVYDESEILIGINRADCSNLEIRVRNNKVMKIIFLVKPDLHLYPVKEIPEGEKRLKGFKPRFEERPIYSDLF